VRLRVSILIPVYNGRRWLAAAIQSALAQTWDNCEVIVLDDGSTDGSGEVARSYGGAIRFEAQPNGGQNVARNRLTTLSSGDWLVYLDADDELAPDAVERKMSSADRADAVYGSMELRRYRGDAVIAAEMFRAVEYDDQLAAAFLWKYPNTSSFMFRKAAVIAAGGWNEHIRSCTDYDLYFRLLLGGARLRAAADSLSVYRHWHAAQASLEDVFRQTTTRLQVMWHAVDILDRTPRWTAAARAAFTNAALGVIRILYGTDPVRAASEHARLRAWNGSLDPEPPFFSRGYRAAYRLLGFEGAERVAAAARILKPKPLPVVSN
jgi:glycosyltransferase involved in cell wall biosynthesis